MGRRISRNWKPTVEMVEHRELLSLVTDIMAGNHNALINSPKVRALLDGVSNPVATQAASASGQVTASATASSQGRLTPTSQSIALPQNQGFLPPASPGYNLVLQPTGTATPAEVKRQLFKAVYRGPYIIGPGSFSSQALQVFIRGAGTATHDAAHRHPDAAGRGQRSHARDDRVLGDLRPEPQFQHRSWARPGDPPHQCRQPRQAQSHHGSDPGRERERRRL